MRLAIVALVILSATGCAPRDRTSARPKFHKPNALDLAIRARDFVEIERLTRAGAPSASRFPYEPPLHQALRTGQSDVAELLIQRGAEVRTLATSEGPLELAAATGNLWLVKLIYGKSRQRERQGWGDTALHAAAKGGHLEVVKYLLDEGFPIDAPEPFEGQTPLGRAAASGQLEVVKYLVQRGANLNPINYRRPLDAAEQGEMWKPSPRAKEVAAFLRQAGARPSSEIPYDQMPKNQDAFRRPDLMNINAWTGEVERPFPKSWGMR